MSVVEFFFEMKVHAAAGGQVTILLNPKVELVAGGQLIYSSYMSLRLHIPPGFTSRYKNKSWHLARSMKFGEFWIYQIKFK